MRNLFHGLFFLVIVTIFSSCTVFRVLKHGNPAIDDYKIFEQDTVEKSNTTFSFIELTKNKRILDTLKLDIYRARKHSFQKMTLDESIDYIQKPAAAIIIKDDTIVYEYYSGGLNKQSQTTI